jgi:hypothetical protein
MRLGLPAERRRTRVLVAAFLLATLGGCGSNHIVVQTVTVEREGTSAAVADADGDGFSEETTSTSNAAPAQRAASSGFRRCDTNISAKKVTTTCGFASNAFYEYWTSNQAARIRVYSPATRRSFSTRCSVKAEYVECATSDGGVARFSQGAVDDYSQAQADAYVANHDTGSASTSSGEAPPAPAATDPPPPPPSTSEDFCDTHDCIPNYDNGNGSTVQCADGTYSQSGGIQGACSHHGGVG